MHTLSTADHGCTPPRIEIPDPYNAADDLLGRNLVAGRGGKVAYIDDAGEYTYDQLAARANRCGNALLGTLGVAPGAVCPKDAWSGGDRHDTGKDVP